MLAGPSFKLLTMLSTLWMKRRCRVLLSGVENLAVSGNGKRTYIVINHSTTFDLVALLHVSKNRFSVVMDEGAFRFPVIGHIFVNAGFIPLVKGESAKAISSAVQKIRSGIPVLMSLTGGGAAVGREERPRTGGIRIAHLSGADIYPIFTAVEESRKYHRSFRGTDGDTHPYTTFRDALYFIDILAPIPNSVFAESETYESYLEIASHLKELAEREREKYRMLVCGQRGGGKNLRCRGGCATQIMW